MSSPPRISLPWWLLVPLAASGFLLWTNAGRLHRLDAVAALVGRANTPDDLDRASPTGYALAQRELIVPGRHEESFHWIAQTQQMLARGEFRVRQVDYDNAPAGREVNATSPYRWWLGLAAWADHLVSGRPPGLSVESAVRWAEPLLHLLVVFAATALVAWRFGGFAAALLAAGLATMFPFAAGFLPGVPDERGLAHACTLGSGLLLLAGLRQHFVPAGRASRRWFLLAGLLGGFGAWVNLGIQLPFIVGTALGALLAAAIERRQSAGAAPPPAPAPEWSAWGVGGGFGVFAAFLGECFPDRLAGWRLEAVHPLYGLAWVGGGEVLARAVAWVRGERMPAGWRARVALAAGLAAVALVPLAWWRTDTWTLFSRDTAWMHLTLLPDGAVATSTVSWWAGAGIDATVVATVLPLLLLLVAAGLFLRRTTDPTARRLLAVAAGPVAVTLALAGPRLGGWTSLDVALLVLLVAVAGAAAVAPSRAGRSIAAVAVAAGAVAGGWQLRPPKSGGEIALNSAEAQQLIERHLAHWLAKRTGEPGVVVYAPPHPSTALAYFGALRGLGSFDRDNRAGFGAALMIAGANTMEEAQTQLQAHGVRYVVLPSWDTFFDDFGRRYLDPSLATRTSFLVHELRRWHLPPWLRPVPYQLPVAGGFEGQSVRVFEMVDEQTPVLAASRLAEFLVETGEMEPAAAAAESLRRFPGDLGALAARAQVQAAQGDDTGTNQTLDSLLSRLSGGADRFLAWDRRVSLAIVLARGNRLEPAREQARRCLADLDEKKLRGLSVGSLYGLLVLGQSFHLEIADPRLRSLAVELLPPDVRSHL